MTSLNRIFTLCAEEDVQLALNGAELEISFDDVISEQLIDLLRENKSQIISYLQDYDSVENNLLIQQITPVNALEPQPLSYQQQRLWFIEQLEKSSTQYNLPVAFKFTGSFDTDVAEQAINIIITRHQALQTRFFSEAGEGKQVVDSLPRFMFTQFDLQGQPQAHALAVEQLTHWIQKPFNLSGDLLLSGCILRTADTEGVIAFNMHHIITDGWSMGVFVKEFVEAYRALSANQTPELTVLDCQYGDYAVWQRDKLDVKTLEPKLFYWQRQLANLPEVHNLPTDYSRPAVQDFSGDIFNQTIDPDVSAQLSAFAQQHNVTLFTLLHTAFSCVLAKYSGSSDIVMGTPVANRLLPEVEPLIGFFANTLVLRLGVVADISFTELLEQSAKVHLQALANQEVPFEMLVERLAPTRTSSYSPLFQIMIAMNNTPTQQLTLPGVSLESLAKPQVDSKFDLTLNIREDGTQLNLEFEYATALFSTETVRHLAESMEMLLTEVLKSPSTAIGALNCTSAIQREWVEQQLSPDLSQVTPAAANLPQLIEQQVTLSAAKEALNFATHTIDYQTLDNWANQLAHWLILEGVKPQQAVAVAMNRDIDLVIAMLAILKVGAYYVPLDLSYPQERLRYMLTDSKSKWLITKQETQSTLQFEDVTELNLDVANSHLEQMPQNKPDVEICEDSLAYVIYTSGSTGKPKGVQITHRNVLVFLSAMQPLLQCEQGVWLALTSVSFDISVLEIFGALSAGFKVIIAPERKISSHQQRHDEAAEVSLENLIAQQQVTHLQCTPSFLQTWLASVQSFDMLDSLQVMFIGGEAFPNNLIEQINQHLDVAVWNMYGPTEATVWSSCKQLTAKQAISLGKPLPGYRFYIVDERLQAVPPGAIGELLIAGEALSPGYYQRDTLTKARFIDNPFANNEHQTRCYKTGDLVRLNGEGELIFCGRADHQVKLRGFRIECGEIEAELSTHSDVERAVVKVCGEETLQQLVAYVVVNLDPQDYDVNTLKQHLAKQLPSHMVPDVVIAMASLPQTNNGKVDRNALPEPQEIIASAEMTPAETEIQIGVAEIWQSLLQVSPSAIGLEANFFDLGGHSLLLMRLTAETKSRFNVELSIRDVFDAPTLGEVAVLIETEIQRHAEAETFNSLVSDEVVDGEESIII